MDLAFSQNWEERVRRQSQQFLHLPMRNLPGDLIGFERSHKCLCMSVVHWVLPLATEATQPKLCLLLARPRFCPSVTKDSLERDQGNQGTPGHGSGHHNQPLPAHPVVTEQKAQPMEQKQQWESLQHQFVEMTCFDILWDLFSGTKADWPLQVFSFPLAPSSALPWDPWGGRRVMGGSTQEPKSEFLLPQQKHGVAAGHIWLSIPGCILFPLHGLETLCRGIFCFVTIPALGWALDPLCN